MNVNKFKIQIQQFKSTLKKYVPVRFFYSLDEYFM